MAATMKTCLTPAPTGPTRRRFFRHACLLAAGAACLPEARLMLAQARADTRLKTPAPIIQAPADPREWPEFRRQLREWRQSTRRDLGYDDVLYRRPEFHWAAACYSCCFLMMGDETFWDHGRGRYRVRAFLQAGREEFGGFDAVVLWHAYPRIGVDDRNQFDFYRDMPGGLPGLRAVARQFHAEGVRVFVDYNPWDTGTRREGTDDLDALAGLVAAVEADGIFLDTLASGSEGFRAKLDRVRPGVVLEGEVALPVERIRDHHLSWAQWFEDREVPGVLRNKWFERRHLQHQIKRWDHDHTGELHTAWMNGSGMMVWENVFGSWMGWNERDKSILRAMLPIQRRFAKLFNGEGWTPLVPTLQPGVYASLWEGDGVRLWTLVNRSDREVRGGLVATAPHNGEVAYDLLLGRRAAEGEVLARPPSEGATQNLPSARTLVGTLPPRGIGCLVTGTPAALGRDFGAFLAGQAARQRRAQWAPEVVHRRTTLAPAAKTPRVKRVPVGMAEIPPAEFEMTIEMRNRECGFYESEPAANHRLGDSYPFSTVRFQRAVRFGRFAIDLAPVTNQEFHDFLRRSRYAPRQRENFLKHWNHGAPPAGREQHPVVYVGLEDARAYAQWARKRLPTEEEWQYAAQGTDGRKFPWGPELGPGRCNLGETNGTTPVRAFPDGRSPFGVYDLVGNVWQWTESERSDGRTRFCILRGGSFFSAPGSNWYVDGGVRPANFATKFLLMWPGLDRCATIGFRCVAELA